MKYLDRAPMLPKVRAFSSLIKLWFSDEPNDSIISLGVCSNGWVVINLIDFWFRSNFFVGSFGFPAGVVFSQTVELNDRNLWQPFSNYPISELAKERISDMLLQIADLLNSYGLTRRKL